MQRRHRAIASFEVDGKIPEEMHRKLAELPADLPRQIEYEQAVDAGLILRQRRSVRYGRGAALVMDVKFVAIASVVVDRRGNLCVKRFREREFRAHLPRQQECISVRNQLIPPNPARLRRGGCTRSKRIFRIRIGINELCEVREDIDLELERLARGLRRHDGLAVFAIALCWLRRAPAAQLEVKRVFPLFRETFRIDIRVPNHERGHERIRHPASRQGYVLKAFVAQIRLADVDGIAVFREWATGGFVAERYVG